MHALSPRPRGQGRLPGSGSPPPAAALHLLSSQHSLPAWLARIVLLAAAILAALFSHGQWSEDPSDGTASLSGTVTYPLTPAEPATCGASGSICNGPFSFSSVASATAQSANLAYPPCQVDQTIATTMAQKDIWFRLDPAFSDAVYRFTLYGVGSPAMTRGGLAVYEAPNATGPFRLLDCSLRGSGATTNNLPSVEATGLTAGYKLFLRVWDLSTPAVPTAISALASWGGAHPPCSTAGPMKRPVLHVPFQQ